MERFVNDILSECPGCPDIIIERKVLQAAILFCNDSWVWQEKITANVVKDSTGTAITPFNDATIAGIISSTVNSRPFTAFKLASGYLTFDEAATEDFTLDLVVAIKPARDVPALEDIFYDDWYEGISAGAKSSLMMMQGKPWFNPELSMFYGKEYRGVMVEAKMAGAQKNDVVANQIKMRPFI